MKKISHFMKEKPVIFTIILSVFLNLFIEILARHSLSATLAYIILNPFITIYNCTIILFTLSAALYFSKRYSVLTVVSFLWVVLGIVNSVLIGLRGTPLSAVDFTILKDAYSLFKLYISIPFMILSAILIVAAIIGIIYLFIRVPKIKPTYIKAIFVTFLSAVLIAFTSEKIVTSETVTAEETDLSQIYSKYGFACCFSYSLLGNGIKTPETYSEETINSILTNINYTEQYNTGKTPNIIMVQLESFFDPSYLSADGLSFSEEPVPNFKKLKNENTHGFLTVPAFGGGTANTEFEILTQIDIHTFGLGEYPYTTVLNENAFESTAYYLKENRYNTHAIHNHTASFYDRNKVYQNLGFDTFTSVEYMTDLKTNPLGWAKDSMLTNEILKALSSTSGKDFVFSVSVQGHGQYPSSFDGELPITVTGIENEEIKTNLEYYLSQIHEMDSFISELTTKLSDYPEDTIVVFYGDHLPSLKLGEINNNKLGYYPISCDRYSTEYVIWSNFSLPQSNEDITAYKLSSKVLDICGIHTGVITQLNQNKNIPKDAYCSYIKLCAYDMLYGNNYLGKIESFSPSAMKMGISDITADNISISGNIAEIKGSGFTEYSVVYANGKEYETTYISPSKLQIDADDITPGMTVSVKQKSEGQILSSSNEITY